MKKKKTMRSQVADEECCALCRLSEDDPALFGEKITLKEHKMSVHYFCLLMSCGVYQRGEEHEGVFGFLVEDIKQEIRRSARLCVSCAAGVLRLQEEGCERRLLREQLQEDGSLPLRQEAQLRLSVRGTLPVVLPGPQSLPVPGGSGPQPAPVLLRVSGPAGARPELLRPQVPVLPHQLVPPGLCAGAAERRQAHSSGLFFFRCTLCSNKERFQEEMLRMGICIPERDASWELEANAYSELLEVYTRCDALACLSSDGRSHAAKTGWFQLLRCRLCGSRGTHRKCSGLKLDSRDWTCSDCSPAADGRASLAASPQEGQRRSLLSKRHPSPILSSLSWKRSPEQPLPLSVQVEGDQALSAGVELVRRPDFDPTRTLSVCFKGDQLTTFPSSLQDGDAARQHFLELLVQQIQDCVVFEGPDGDKNLALDSQALREDLYYDVGCLLALSLAHGGPPVCFFSGALYQSLFNHPPGRRLAVAHMTPDALATRRVARIAAAESSDELLEAVAASSEFLELAGCRRPVGGLEDREALVEQLVGFTMTTRMQLPLQRFREGLQTLAVFHQMFPQVFSSVFCDSRLSARSLSQAFSFLFSQQEVLLSRETPVSSFWTRLLLDCEVGRSSISLQDLLLFATGAEELPSAGLLPPPAISFLHPKEGGGGGGDRRGGERGRVRRRKEPLKDEGLFPQSEPGCNRLLLPVCSSYLSFKSNMEQAVSHQLHLLPPR
ncbi:G2/M phase-specific E3 ubiquitin-protein ligase isoform X2 [Clinocottus analis]|uniref:G2/M phase-specific E3 ubiquitin-protein ligase isoform X2 n=1 Tax=Clinocottus analis TaxID=304258 RepID=UPI0035BF61B5